MWLGWILREDRELEVGIGKAPMAEEQIQAARSPSDGPTAASLRGENSPLIHAGILPEMGNNVFSGFHQSKRKLREK